MAVIPYKDDISTEVLGSKSAITLAIAIARELKRRGHQLDVRGIGARLDLLSGDEMAFYYNRIYEGSLITNTTQSYPLTSTLELDLGFLETSPVFENRGIAGELHWSFDYAKSTYTDKNATVLHRMNSTVLAVTAKHIVDVYEGITEDKVVLHFTTKESGLYTIYMPIMSALEWLPKYAKYFSFDIGDDDKKLDFRKYIFSSLDQGHDRQLTVPEKLSVMKDLGYRVGGIYVMWERKIKSDTNFGHLVPNPLLVRIDAITDRFIRFTRFPRPASKEEQMLEFLRLDETISHKFLDIISSSYLDRANTEQTSLYSLAIDNFLGYESFMLLKLDTSEMVRKHITVCEDGIDIVREVEITAVDYIYTVLKQYNVPFDEELYLDNYYDEETTPVYDLLSIKRDGRTTLGDFSAVLD